MCISYIYSIPQYLNKSTIMKIWYPLPSVPICLRHSVWISLKELPRFHSVAALILGGIRGSSLNSLLYRLPLSPGGLQEDTIAEETGTQLSNSASIVLLSIAQLLCHFCQSFTWGKNGGEAGILLFSHYLLIFEDVMPLGNPTC